MYQNRMLAALAANPNVKFRAELYAKLDEVLAGTSLDNLPLRRGYKRPIDMLKLTYKLMLARPTWRFYEGRPTYSLDCSGYVLVHDADDVYLGVAWVDHEGYYIKNHRTVAQGKHKEYRSTKDEGKAVAMVLKIFGHATPKELVNAAFTKAYESIRYRCERLSSAADSFEGGLKDNMLEFCRDPEIFKLFVERAKTIPTWDHVLNKYTKYSAMLTTTEGVKRELDRGTATLILRVENEYIVRRLDNVSVYNDSSLPTEYREQLGLLKLSNVDKYLEGIGVRVAEDVFVLGEKKDGATNE